MTITALARTLWRCREEAWIAVARPGNGGRVLPFDEIDGETRRVYMDTARRLLRHYDLRRRKAGT